MSNRMCHQDKARTVRVGPLTISNDSPCKLFVGPCAVDRQIYRIMEEAMRVGVDGVRGGCYKPRTNARTFPGLGRRGVRMLLEAARVCSCPIVLIEVMDGTQLYDVLTIRDEVGYDGEIIPWIGARTENQALLRMLGRKEFAQWAVMLKNPIRARSIIEWLDKVEFVLAGEAEFDEEGRQTSDWHGNENILLCCRGIEGDQPNSYRFNPCYEWIEAARRGCCERFGASFPVGFDPSHSAGKTELVLENLREAVKWHPAFVLVEVYSDGEHALCDAKQALPLSRLRELKDCMLSSAVSS